MAMFVRHESRPSNKCGMTRKEVLAGTKFRIFSYLITKVQGLPLPKEVRNPRGGPHSIK